MAILDDLLQKRTKTFAFDSPASRDSLYFPLSSSDAKRSLILLFRSPKLSDITTVFDEILFSKQQYVNPLYEDNEKTQTHFVPLNVTVPLWCSLLLRHNKVVFVQHRKIRKQLEDIELGPKNEKGMLTLQSLFYLDHLSHLADSKQLAFEHNYISHVSPDIATLTQLTHLGLDNNNLLSVRHFLSLSCSR